MSMAALVAGKGKAAGAAVVEAVVVVVLGT
jgi:hypothetical protein